MTTQTSRRRTVAAELPNAPRIPEARFRGFGETVDYQRLSDLVAICHAQDGIPWLPTAETLRIEMEQSSAMNPTRDVLFAEVGGRIVAATSLERTLRDDVPVYDIWGNVHPEYRRRGLGSALLGWTIDRIRQRAAIEDPGVAVMVQGDAEQQETGHRAMLERAGFEPVRHFFVMRRALLARVPDAPFPDGVEVRPVTTDQRRAILDAEFEAFRDHWGHREWNEDSYRTTFAHAELNTGLWVVAWDVEQIAGVVENWIWPDENQRLAVTRGWLERISVRRPWRRRGLARALTAASLVRLREAGMAEAMLAVDSENPNGALGLYEGLGFEIHGRSAAYRRPLEPSRSGE